MTAQTYNVPADGFSPADLAQAQAKLAHADAARKASMGPQSFIASKQQVNIQGGVMSSATSTYKDGSNTAYVSQVKPGYIEVPGLGQTPIDAAKAGGLIPQNWVEGQPLPFDNAPATQGRSKAAQDGTPTGSKEGADKGPETSPEVAHAAHLAKLAGGVLDQVNNAHGTATTDGLLEAVAESGDIESIMDRLPEGFQAVQAKQVMAGYVAQANHTLSAVGSTVPMLEEFLDDDELRNARRATLSNSPDMLHELGRAAVDRLAALPQKDPKAFQEMVDGMDAKSKEMLRYDRQRGAWIMTMPDGSKMSYGAAVRMGIITV